MATTVLQKSEYKRVCIQIVAGQLRRCDTESHIFHAANHIVKNLIGHLFVLIDWLIFGV
jgi:hypothetical protein